MAGAFVTTLNLAYHEMAKKNYDLYVQSMQPAYTEPLKEVDTDYWHGQVFPRPPPLIHSQIYSQELKWGLKTIDFKTVPFWNYFLDRDQNADADKA